MTRAVSRANLSDPLPEGKACPSSPVLPPLRVSGLMKWAECECAAVAVAGGLFCLLTDLGAPVLEPHLWRGGGELLASGDCGTRDDFTRLKQGEVAHMAGILSRSPSMSRRVLPMTTFS